MIRLPWVLTYGQFMEKFLVKESTATSWRQLERGARNKVSRQVAFGQAVSDPQFATAAASYAALTAYAWRRVLHLVTFASIMFFFAEAAFRLLVDSASFGILGSRITILAYMWLLVVIRVLLALLALARNQLVQIQSDSSHMGGSRREKTLGVLPQVFAGQALSNSVSAQTAVRLSQKLKPWLLGPAYLALPVTVWFFLIRLPGLDAVWSPNYLMLFGSYAFWILYLLNRLAEARNSLAAIRMVR